MEIYKNIKCIISLLVLSTTYTESAPIVDGISFKDDGANPSFLAGVVKIEMVNEKLVPKINSKHYFAKSNNTAHTERRSGTCTGTILDERTVLTAAHCCTSNEYFKKMIIYAGLNNRETYQLDSNQQHQIKMVYNTENIKLHEKWMGSVMGGADICLISLENQDTFQFNDYVQPQKLESREIPNGASLIAAGHGRTNRDMRGNANGVRVADVVLHQSSACINLMRKNPKEFPQEYLYVYTPAMMRNLCIIRENSIEVKTGNPCNGDSGGPIFTVDAEGNFAIAGILSWGTPKSCTLFTAYESMTSNRDWLEENLGDGYFNYSDKEEVLEDSQDGVFEYDASFYADLYRD